MTTSITTFLIYDSQAEEAAKLYTSLLGGTIKETMRYPAGGPRPEGATLSVALNHAVAVAMARGPAEGLALLEQLDGDPRIKDHYRKDAVRGHLLERSGEVEAAVRYYEAAAEKTACIPERNYLLLKLGRLRATGSPPRR
jgi:predicted 3-demethylubiquinone-9 3-methyltransferase (glyoxalase superfamily)